MLWHHSHTLWYRTLDWSIKKGYGAGRRGSLAGIPAASDNSGSGEFGPAASLVRSDMSTTLPPTKGLEGVVAASSSICYIDGDRGILAYRGYDIHDLADFSTFEETCYLLWYGKLPSRDELKKFRTRLAGERKLDPAIIKWMKEIPKTATPMEVLRTMVSALSFYD